MTYYLYNKKNEIYCEPLHKVHMPEMAASGFDTEARAKAYAVTIGLKAKDLRVRRLVGAQEMLTLAGIRGAGVGGEYAFLPVGDGMRLRSLDTGVVVTARGYEYEGQT